MFPGDHASELALTRRRAIAAGAVACCLSTAYVDGVAGSAELAHEVVSASADGAANRRGDEWPAGMPLAEQVGRIACELYGADGVEYAPAAREGIEQLERLGFGRLPVCTVKTPLSLSHDPQQVGAPTGFRLPVREVRLWCGAGLVHVICGTIQTMPRLPSRPGFQHVDLVDGRVVGPA